MKKLILLPLMVLPLLTGCNNQQKEPQISLTEWLTDLKEETPTYFEIEVDNKSSRGGYSDYEFKVAEIIKENTKDMSLKACAPITELSEESKSYPVRYIVDRKIDYYARLEVRIDEECLLMWAYGYGKNHEYFEEITEYSLPKESGKKLIEKVDARCQEMRDLANKSHNEVYEQTTPETFYSFVEEATTEPSIFYNNKETRDTNKSLLNDIKEFAFIEVDYIFSGLDDAVTYGVDNNYKVSIGRGIFDKEPLVRFIKYYDNPALRYDGDNLSECWRTYSVSEEKFNNFMAKVKAM